MKINISIDDELVERIDSFAKKNYTSRSGVISFAASQYLNQSEVVGAVIDLSVCVRKIASQGYIDDEAKAQLNEFENFCKVITGK